MGERAPCVWASNPHLEEKNNKYGLSADMDRAPAERGGAWVVVMQSAVPPPAPANPTPHPHSNPHLEREKITSIWLEMLI